MINLEIPLHITGFWIIKEGNDEYSTGSLGAGLLLKPKVKVLAENKKGDVYLNGKKLKAKFLEDIFSAFGKKISIKIKSPVDLGIGYGLSGAISLAAALSLGFISGKSLLESAKIAHFAEVKNRTGLGDVIAQFLGKGLEIRLKPGAPGIGEIISLKVPGNISVITVDLGKEQTEKVLNKKKRSINKYGKIAYDYLLKKPSLENFLKASKFFSKKVGFLDERIEKIMKKCEDYLLGYYVKKKVLVAVSSKTVVSKVVKFFSKNLKRPKILKVDNEGLLIKKLDYKNLT